ncbi:hypothetical protein HRI_000009000 [Hibiscus trionum]|uniref:Uncharacterized protein n=1 Tax=Hibiscus trionum TaxID=183268 RepID=A0A9W7GPI4_HIBTR|nr:hypothetical protein HRI_000009000 [Hibiscus trionum]
MLYGSFSLMLQEDIKAMVARISCSAHPTPPRRLSQIVFRKSGDERFASISSSSNQQTSSVVVNPYPIVPPPSSQMVAAFLDWSRCWALSTFYMGGFKLKALEVELGTSMKQ